MFSRWFRLKISMEEDKEKGLVAREWLYTKVGGRIHWTHTHRLAITFVEP